MDEMLTSYIGLLSLCDLSLQHTHFFSQRAATVLKTAWLSSLQNTGWMHPLIYNIARLHYPNPFQETPSVPPPFVEVVEKN